MNTAKPIPIPTHPSTTLSRGYLIALTGTVFWSFTAVFIRYLSDTYRLAPLALAFWRDAIVFVVLGGLFAAFRPAMLRFGWKHGRFLSSYGVLLSIFNALWTVSVILNGAAVSTVLAYSSVGFTAVIGWRLFGERLDRVKIVAVGLSILGCTLVSGAYLPANWGLNPVGILTGLLSGVAFAAYSLMGKEAARRSINPWTVLLYTFGIAAVLLLAYNSLFGQALGGGSRPDLFAIGSSLAGWAVIFVLAVGPTIGGYGLYTVSLTHLPASVANLIATLEPSLTAVLAYLLLGERFTPPQLIGSLLIIAGVMILRVSEK